MVPLVQLENVARTYQKGRIHALLGISLSVAHGDSMAITGPSGSGKSTLLQIIGAMDQPTSGTVLFEGEKSPHRPSDWARLRRRCVGFVFQNFHLLPNLTALENVQVPMLGVLRSAFDRRERARRLLDRVGLADRALHRPSELSGGEQQRVAIARALANDPPLLLADEPTGNLDSKNAAEVLDLLLELHRGHGAALVLVTHEPSFADRLGTTVRLLDGKIQN